jgi:WD40 repeat protein
LWDVETARPRGPALWHADQIADVAFAPDASLLATRDEGGIVRLWRIAARPAHGQPVLEIPATAFAFGPAGKWLAAALENEIQRWDLTALQPVGKPLRQDNLFPALACSPDGALLAAASEKGVQLWDVADGSRHGRLLEFPTGAAMLAFTPIGKRLAAMSGQGEVQMWDPENGKPHEPPFQDGPAQAAFSIFKSTTMVRYWQRAAPSVCSCGGPIGDNDCQFRITSTAR